MLRKNYSYIKANKTPKKPKNKEKIELKYVI